MISQGTVRLLLNLLDQVVLRGNEPNIEEAATSIATARRELEALIIAEDLSLMKEEAWSQ